MTDAALVRRYERVHAMQEKLEDKLITAGLGHLRSSELRAGPQTPLTVKYLALLDEAAELRAEAERRYGPGLLMVRQLVWRS